MTSYGEARIEVSAWWRDRPRSLTATRRRNTISGMARTRPGIGIGGIPVHHLAAIAVAAWLCAPRPAAADPSPPGPSFDCARAQGVVQTTICGDPELVAADRTTAQLFALVRTDALGVGPSAEPDEQRKWLSERDNMCAAKIPYEMTACLRQEFDARLALLAVAALIRAPEPALAELRRQDPEHAPIYEALWRMATMPAGAARTDAVAALIGPAFEKVRTAGRQGDDPDHGGGPITAAMLGSMRTARDAASTVKNFDLFFDLTGIVDTIGPAYLTCEAIVRQPELIDAVGVSFGERRQDGLGVTDCDDELPAPPQFAAFAAAAIDAATASPRCTEARRAVAVPLYQRLLIVVQLDRQGTRPPPSRSVAAKAAAFAGAHAADESAAEADLTAYYGRELRLPGAADAAHAAIGQVLDKAFATCP
jgi:uncharacterized protein